MNYVPRSFKTFVEFTNPDPTYPARRVIVREVQPGSFYAAKCEAEYDSLIYVLSGEMGAVKGRSVPNSKKNRVGYTFQLLGPGDACRISECRNNFLSFQNTSSSEPLLYLHMVINPRSDIRTVTHEAVCIEELEQKDQSRLIASADGRRGSMTVHSDVDIYLASLRDGEILRREAQSKGRILIQVAKGCVETSGMWLWPFDGPVVEGNDGAIELVSCSDGTEVLLVEAA